MFTDRDETTGGTTAPRKYAKFEPVDAQDDG
jgi:hypothetical protein